MTKNKLFQQDPAPVKFRLVIGIDPGTHTGFAVWDREARQFREIKTLGILEAVEALKGYQAQQESAPLFVRIEDPNQRKWFGKSGREKLQGAGSVKRDFKILKTYLEREKIPFQACAPKDLKTKVKADLFQKITGYQGRTSEHARDAALMVYQF